MRICLYCKETDVPFNTVEHVIPESLGNARLRMFAPGKIEIGPGSSKKAFQVDRDKGRATMQLMSHLRMTPDYRRTITRALFKMTLGCMYLREPGVALSQRFDPVRRMILDLDTFHGYFGVSKKAYRPTSNKGAIQLSYKFFENDRGEESVACHFFFLGVGMFTDLEIREWQPPADLPDFATVLEF